MKEIFEQHGAAIITVIVIVALAAVIGFLLSKDGTVQREFAELLTGFFEQVKPAN